MGLLPYNASLKGRICYCGEELTQKRKEQLRGKEIVLVPQSVSYLDPLVKVGAQVRRGKKDADAKRRLRDIFARYHLREEAEQMYPFELSGGMSRRVLIAAAMIERPKLVIADEPTPGLDEATAKKVMGHFRELADTGAGVLVITHDLELAAEMADRVVVFYAGSTIEEAAASDFEREENLRHPFTRALWRAMPGNGFHYIEGSQPYVKNMPEGCPFSPRCAMCTEECRKERDGGIAYRNLRGGRVRCLYAK